MSYGIDYIKSQNINSQEFIDKVSQYGCDLFISMSFNQIFKSKIMHLPPLKTINCHAGKLPFYRGRNVLNWVLINDEKEFGITVHYVDEGVDTGDIILQRTYPITDSDSYETLLFASHKECAEVLYDALLMLIEGSIQPIKQNTIHPTGFYCSQRKDGDEFLDWNQGSRTIFNFVRAISNPGPIARAYINGIEMKINKVKLIPEAPIYKGILGTILGKDDIGFYVKTKDSFVKVVEFEYDGKIKTGDRFEIR